LKFWSRAFCVDSQKVEECFKAAVRAKTAEEQPQIVKDLVLITQACIKTKQTCIRTQS
jgi:hypothetical protein